MPPPPLPIPLPALRRTLRPILPAFHTIRRHLPPLRKYRTLPPPPPKAFPPESPKFVRIPEPPQSSEPVRTRMRGHLPVPRDLFTRRTGPGRRLPRKVYFLRTTPVSQAEAAGEPPKNAVEARQRRLAQIRRAALRESLMLLYRRKWRRERREAARLRWRAEAISAAARAPERAADVLTRSTVRLATADVDRLVERPDPFEEAEQARRRTEAIAARKSEARKDALSRLYMASKGFIVTEEELEAEVNRLFSQEYWDKYRNPSKGGPMSAWDRHGIPVSLAGMFVQGTRASDSIVDQVGAPKSETSARQQRLAEELTGGKLE